MDIAHFDTFKNKNKKSKQHSIISISKNKQVKKKVIILGAKSDIAKISSWLFAKNGFDLLLVGRNVESELKEFGISISEEFGQKISLYDLDILDRDATDLFLTSNKFIPDGIISFVGFFRKSTKSYKRTKPC